MKTSFRTTDYSQQVTFEHKECFVQTINLPSGEEVIEELTTTQAIKRMADLERQGYIISEME